MPLSGDRHVVALWMDEPPILAAVQPAGHRPPKSDALPRQIRHCGPSAPQATRSRRMQAGPNGRLAPVEARTVDQGQPLRQRPAAATVTGGYTGPGPELRVRNPVPCAFTCLVVANALLLSLVSIHLNYATTILSE